MITCPQCGTQNLPGMAYCEHCGSPLNAPEQVAATGTDTSAQDAIAQAQAMIDQLNAQPAPATPTPTAAASVPIEAADQAPAVPAADAQAVKPEAEPATEDANAAAPAAPSVAPVLTIIFPNGGQHEVTTDVTNVGRSDVAQNWHPELDLIPFGGASPDLGVSRHQALIQRNGNRFSLTDVGSTNGTFVNGHALEYNQPVELHDGDSVAFGAFNAKISIR